MLRTATIHSVVFSSLEEILKSAGHLSHHLVRESGSCFPPRSRRWVLFSTAQEAAPSPICPPPVHYCLFSGSHRPQASGHWPQGQRVPRGERSPNFASLLPTKGKSLPRPTSGNVFPSPRSSLMPAQQEPAHGFQCKTCHSHAV